MRRVLVVLVAVGMLLASGSASARPAGCVVVIDGATRDAAVAAMQKLMGGSMMLGDWMIDMASLQEAQRVIGELQAAPAFGCEPDAF